MRRTLVCAAILVTGSVLAAACGGDDESDLQPATGGAAGSAAGGDGGTAGSSGGAGGGAGVASGGVTSGGSGGGTPGSIKFVAIGDAGKGNAEQKQVADAIQAKCAASGCDFVQLLGDNIYDSGVSSVDDPQWQEKFEIPYATVALPFWVVLGNHDNGGSGTGSETWKGDIQVAYSLKTQKWKLPARYYVHQEPGIDFFGLDTNAGMFNTHATQKTDVAGWLGVSTATWKIAFGHHPYLSSGVHGDATGKIEKFYEDRLCGRVDLYLAGHDHDLQVLDGTTECPGVFVVSGGGGALPRAQASPDHPGLRFAESTNGFAHLEFGEGAVRLRMIDTDGDVLFDEQVLP